MSTSLVAAGGGDPENDEDGGGDGEDGTGENDGGSGGNGGTGSGSVVPAGEAPATPVGVRRSAGGGGAGGDGDSVQPPDWWSLLTPEQQRRIVAGQVLPQPAAPVVPPPARAKRKKLDVEDWSSTGLLSVESWLGRVHAAIQRHSFLDGEEWTTKELYYGVSARLTGAAAEWFNDLSGRVRREDRTLEYITDQLEKAYGSRDTDWQIQRKLGSRSQRPGERLTEFARHLREIGRGHPRVQESWYVEAFLEGINNKFAGSMTRMTQPRTLMEAVQAAVDSCGEYGEGREVGWQVAAQLHAADRPLGGTVAATAAAPATAVAAPVGALDDMGLSKLGIGLADNGEEPPKFDKYGKRVSGLAAAAGAGRDGGLSLAALQAIAIATRVGQAAQPASAASGSGAMAVKPKVAKALEVKAEATNPHETEYRASQATDQTMERRIQGYQQEEQGVRYRDGQDRGGNYDDRGGNHGEGYDRGDGSGYGGRKRDNNRDTGRYGPNSYHDNGSGYRRRQPDGDHPCFYCKETGHWIRDCPERLEDLRRRRQSGSNGSGGGHNSVNSGTGGNSGQHNQNQGNARRD
ncbi:hypothetical protein BBJ28_00023039 [Nothophytophthora sp. Chile5]|nr:hypothetical protein BBJ28_00023039 [Nothophytophthora sp. Chile5]